MIVITNLLCFVLSDIIPRSILMVEMGDIYYLLCALGDGCLIYYILNLSNGKTQSVNLMPTS